VFVIPLRDNAELRPLEPHHAEEFLANLDRARAHIAPWVGAGFVATDLAGARKVLAGYADGQAADRRRIYGIWLDGTLVGGTMFVGYDLASGTGELGCWLQPSAEGHGLIIQVIRMMIDWAFRERGLVRLEWHTLPDNARSIAVARRAGMRLDGTFRQAAITPTGRRDLQIWSLLADEWDGGDADASDPAGVGTAEIKAELDRLTRTFLSAFTNTGGTAPRTHLIREVFVPDGVIVNNAGAEPVRTGVEGFIAPRERILTDGTLTEFSEWEVSDRTEIIGSVAHRPSHYRKSGILNGERFEGSGHKSIQFIRTPDGWRMSALAWDDDPAA